MSKDKEKKVKPDSPKKQTRLQVANQLRTSLTELETLLGKKEYEDRIKKAAKLLTEGIKVRKEKEPKKAPKKEKTAKIEKIAG